MIDADESDCLVMSLVENCARRQHNPIDLMREIGALRERGYNDRQIGEKIGVSAEYVNMIAGLLEKGEERLVSAVETGVLPLNLAIQIAKTDAKGAQKALMDAYTQNKLRGRKLALVRRLIQQRELRGPQIQSNPLGRRIAKRALTSEGLVRAYQQEATRQKLLIKKAELTQSRLMFVRGGLPQALADEHFVTLLRAEGLATMPGRSRPGGPEREHRHETRAASARAAINTAFEKDLIHATARHDPARLLVSEEPRESQ